MQSYIDELMFLEYVGVTIMGVRERWVGLEVTIISIEGTIGGLRQNRGAATSAMLHFSIIYR